METDPGVPLEPPHYTPDGELVKVSVLPKPYQKPHPPITQMVTSNRSWEVAGARGLFGMGSARSLEGVREGFEAYKRGTESACKGLPLGEKTSIQYMTFCAKTMEEAFEIARPGINDLYGKHRGAHGSGAAGPAGVQRRTH